MCIVMETNELPSIDDKLVDTSTIHTTKSIFNLINFTSRVNAAGSTRRRRAALLPQGNTYTQRRFYGGGTVGHAPRPQLDV